uniref:Uncharacterized protein n=1 Tax=Cynoglossus semilaevis TaxID=244447 RepID=A0A3P8VR20_CYNSE
MAAPGANLKSEDHFLCSICLSVFTDPVSTPCGHNFCKKCITKHWNISRNLNCPMCKEVFSTRPHLKGTVMRAVDQLEEFLKEQMTALKKGILSRMQQFEVDVTLDPNTAQQQLVLSEDRKLVHFTAVRKNLLDIPERFSHHPCVLATQSFSSGRFYFEVQVKGKTDWVLGVARESINRKGELTLIPQYGYWTTGLRHGKYIACDNPPVSLPLVSPPERVGVFVDYDTGLVSFYDVDAAVLIYSFTSCSFTDKLYPLFSPWFNDGAGLIKPVNFEPGRMRNK